MKGMVAEKLLPYPCLMWEEGTGEERVFIYPCREQEEGTGEERVFIYPSREREEGTGEERVFIYPSREREEGTEELCTASLFSGLSDPAGFLHLCKAKIIMQNKNNLPEKRR